MDREKIRQRYQAAESWFDKLLDGLTASPWSLALFALWTLLAIAFGMWVSK